MRWLVTALLLSGCSVSPEPRMFVSAAEVPTVGEERPSGYIVFGAPNDGRIVIAIGAQASIGLNTTAKTLNIRDTNNNTLCDSQASASLIGLGGGRYRAEATADCGYAWAEWLE